MPLNSADSGRAYAAGKYAIEVDGVNAGWLHSTEGGDATADVTVEKLGVDHVAKKHISNVKYEDIKMVFGTGMSKAFYNWMKDSFDHKYSRKNGALIAANYNFKEMSRLTFSNALISEIGLPALDAASKDAAKMSMTIQPEITRRTTTAGGGPPMAGAINPKVQKQWLPANFQLSIDGHPEPCSKVNKVEAITIKQKNILHEVGQERDYQREPASIEFPNLVITFPESHADSMYKWHEDFVIKGNCGDDKELNGSLIFKSTNFADLFTVTFKHLGIFKLTVDKVESHAESIRRVKAEMYCEEMSFDYKEAWA